MLGMHHHGRAKGHPLAEASGWIGAASVLLAYGLAAFGMISAEGWLYALLNLIGAIGIVIIAAVKKVIQSVLLNVIWAVIAVVALVKLALG